MYIIKKYPVNIYFKYSDGDESHHLVAHKILLEKRDSCSFLVINLSSNLKVLNKEMTCYKESEAIKNQNVYINSFRIESEKFIRNFELEYDKLFKSKLILELRFSKDCSLFYSIKLGDTEKYSCYFKILEKLEMDSP